MVSAPHILHSYMSSFSFDLGLTLLSALALGFLPLADLMPWLFFCHPLVLPSLLPPGLYCSRLEPRLQNAKRE